MRHTSWIATATLLVIALATSACQASTQPPPAPTPSPSPGPSVLVTHRAANPSQENAPGIQFTSGSVDITVAAHAINIAASDWNTIVDTSVVAHSVGVGLDPDFNASATTRNRFQYMADLIEPYAGTTFGPIGIVAEPVGSTIVAIVALINPTNDTYQLSGLRVTVTMSPPLTTVASATFYSGSNQALIITGKEIYFARLKLPLSHNPPTASTSTDYSFHWGRLYNCGTVPCPAVSN